MINPAAQLNEIIRAYPATSRWVNEIARDKGTDIPDWPSWCFIPMAGWYAIVSAQHDVQRLPFELITDVSKLAALGTWRYSQGIYRFDESLREALTQSTVVGSIPCDVLLRLPEWCLYIETPGMRWENLELAGFWVHLEWDTNENRKELRFLLDTAGGLIGVPMHLGDWTVTEAVDRVMSVAKMESGQEQFTAPRVVQDLASGLNPLVSLVLYLCSDEPEIDDARQPGASPSRAVAKKIKKGWQLFPAEKPRTWDVGTKAGQSLRQNLESTQGDQTVRPHLRRAHWHGVWTGPRDGERKFKYNWIPPILVNSGTKE